MWFSVFLHSYWGVPYRSFSWYSLFPASAAIKTLLILYVLAFVLWATTTYLASWGQVWLSCALLLCSYSWDMVSWNKDFFFVCLFVFCCCILYDLYVFILYPCKHNSTLHISISQTEIKSIILYLSFFLLFFYLSFLYTSVTFYFAKCIVQIYALPDDCVQIIMLLA